MLKVPYRTKRFFDDIEEPFKASCILIQYYSYHEKTSFQTVHMGSMPEIISDNVVKAHKDLEQSSAICFCHIQCNTYVRYLIPCQKYQKHLSDT